MTQEPKPKKSRSRLIIFASLGLLGLCLCVVVAVVFAPDTGEVEQLETAQVAQVQDEAALGDQPEQQPTAVEIPTATEVPTSVTSPTLEPSPTAEPGISQENPAPFGSEVAIKEITLKVDEVKRPATDEVKQANMFNDDPEPGEEYILVKVSLLCTLPADERCHVDQFQFKLFGSSGLIREYEFVAGLPNMIESTDFFGGASYSGWLSFFVGENETGLVLAYEPLFGLSTAYFQLPEKE